MKSNSSVNYKLVTGLKRHWLAKINQKMLWSLVLTTNQINTPIGYPFFYSVFSIFSVSPVPLIEPFYYSNI